MVLEVGENDSTQGVAENWEIPEEFDESTNAVVNIKCEEEGFEFNEDHDFDYEDIGQLVDVSGGLPDDIGQLALWITHTEVEHKVNIYMESDGTAQHKYTLTLLSFEHNGQHLYP